MILYTSNMLSQIFCQEKYRYLQIVTMGDCNWLNPNLAIPDRDPAGVVGRVIIPDSGQLREINIYVDIARTCIGDLCVSVSNPQKHEVVLHAQKGRLADDFQRTYTVDYEAALRAFIGQPADCDRILSISDKTWRDVGNLNRWGLTLQ